MDEDVKRVGCWILAALIIIPVALLGLRLVLFPVWYANRTVDVVQKETDPAELLNRYEWFKEASAQLDKKQADIQVYEQRVKSLSEAYAGKPRTEWARDDREQMSIWQSEVAGTKASYNDLAAKYNAQMAKFNYAFTNQGDLPKGATKPLPREYKPYETH